MSSINSGCLESGAVAAAPLMTSEQQTELRRRTNKSDRIANSSGPNSSLDRGDPRRRSGRTSLSAASSNESNSASAATGITSASNILEQAVSTSQNKLSALPKLELPNSMYGHEEKLSHVPPALSSGTPLLQHDSTMPSVALLVDDDLSDVRVGSPTLAGASGTSFPYYHKMDRTMFETPERREKMKREKLKDQKLKYRKEKKRAAKEILSTLRDPSVVLMADYLKVRGMLKSWTKFWCVLNPGILILYKSQKRKSGHWVGSIVLNSAKLIERPSKKDGFCFKIYHPLDQSVWAQKGPEGETLGAITQPLMYSSAIFRAPSETAGKTWMDALDLALRCSSLLLRTAKIEQLEIAERESGSDTQPVTPVGDAPEVSDTIEAQVTQDDLDESDRENHFKDILKDLKDNGKGVEGATDATDSESTTGSDTEDDVPSADDSPTETRYVENAAEHIVTGAGTLSEEFAEDNKNIIWTLMKQVRPGMDLSKVVLPTFILEPRSLLEKFADYYYHCDILSNAARCEDALTRMKEVVRWYVSGFYKTPKGVKKPYNPILGETFRCYWKNPESGSRTFYIAEQISHHPPVSAFYVTNRQDGFSLNCSVLAKSKFYGNSVAANMEGTGKLTFLRLGEEYAITLPYGYAKGIIVGSLTMELGGKITIECEKTGYRAELEFKLKPFMGGSDSSSKITGKIKLGHETLFSLDGRWDQEIFIKDRTTGKSASFWKVEQTTLARRLPRFTVPMNDQTEFESERLWQHVSESLKLADQEKATHEKWLLEDTQRKGAKERRITNTVYNPRLFEQDNMSGNWIYKFSDLRPWDPVNDIMQYEFDYRVLTKTKHKTPLVRSMSIVNVNGSAEKGASRSSRRNAAKRAVDLSESSTPSRTSDTEGVSRASATSKNTEPSKHKVEELPSDFISRLQPLAQAQKENSEKLRNIQTVVVQLAQQQNHGVFLQARDWCLLALILILQTILQWLFR